MASSKRSPTRTLLLATALACCACGAPGDPGGSVVQEGATGRIHVVASEARLSQAGVTRVTVDVLPGAGPSFEPILGALSRGASAGWSAFLSGIPSGPGRSLELTAFDAGGVAVFRGGTQIDVTSGTTAWVMIILQEVAPPPGPTDASPVIEFLSVSSGTVVPGGTSTFKAGVSATGQGDAVTYAWGGTCGTFADRSQAIAFWTAPAAPDQRCQLSFTAATASLSTTVHFSVEVRQDSRTRDVSGQRMVSCWEDPQSGAAASRPPARAAPDVGALAAPDALVQESPGVWVTHPGGHLSADGSFVAGGFSESGAFIVPQVPLAASYFLSFIDGGGVRWLVETESSTIDLGYDQLGRCDLQAAGPDTGLALDLTGLYPWSAQSSALQLTSSGANLWAQVPTHGNIVQGSTTGLATASWTARPLLAPTDVLWVHQLTPVLHPDGFGYRSAVRAGTVAGAATVDGAVNTFDVGAHYVSQSGRLAVDWSAPDFELHLPLMAPPSRVVAGVIAPHRLSVSASAYTLQAPAPTPPGGSPELASLELPAGAARFSLSSPLRYGQFLPPSWLEWREIRYATAVTYLAPAATLPFYEISAVGRRDALPASADAQVPSVTPVQSLRINGTLALLDQAAAVTATPTFSWLPPVLGAPSYYSLEVFELGAAGGATVSRTVLRALTRSTTMTLPPGLLTAGRAHYAKVTAFASPVPFDSAPLRSAPVYSYATTLTGTFTP